MYGYFSQDNIYYYDEHYGAYYYGYPEYLGANLLKGGLVSAALVVSAKKFVYY
jgi:hypothetical protein